jgi:hypothetical protein
VPGLFAFETICFRYYNEVLGRIGKRKNGIMEDWNNGTMGQWKTGILEDWNTGIMGQRKRGDTSRSIFLIVSWTVLQDSSIPSFHYSIIPVVGLQGARIS